ncbi:uncharacterized protein BJ171DRAFT_187003 [Polychytrium aggregatum]|uniref:uncharacterized protein n=1 Tax=Polychytrium aggregatum TaxID=110093 RepID=UPI0022FE9C37|nr:uncharacterized protein BJ171DRAFT_187003 [Polychytrium aggregatum]KAI9202176.1 hypothetical protein BJ171DRAFT_187003 [Polychytrium aggregatum]
MHRFMRWGLFNRNICSPVLGYGGRSPSGRWPRPTEHGRRKLSLARAGSKARSPPGPASDGCCPAIIRLIGADLLMAVRFLQTDNLATWHTALDSEIRAVQAASSRAKKSGPSLDDLHGQVHGSLAKRIRTEPSPSFSVDDLGLVMKWKLSMGKFRPRLFSLVTSNTDQLVQKATHDGLAAVTPVSTLDSVVRAIQALSVLSGVGVATASAILSIYDPSVPFMSDEALAEVGPAGKLAYTLPAYKRLYETLKSKAAELNKLEGKSLWTPGACERAIRFGTIALRLGALDKDAFESAATNDVKPSEDDRGKPEQPVEGNDAAKASSRGKRKRQNADDLTDNALLRRSARTKRKS